MIDAAVVALYLGAVVWLGFRGALRRRPGMADYVLAGRTLTLPLFVSTLVPTFYGGVLGIGEFTWLNGLSNWTVMALPYYLFAAAYACFLAGRIRLQPGLTIADHLEDAYGRKTALLAGFLVFLIACPADELLMTGTILAHLAGLPLPLAMGLCALAALSLVLRGGLRSDLWANRLEIVVMFLGFALILPFAWSKLGGPASWRGLPAGHLSLTGGLSPWALLSWWLIALWTIVDPAFHQRCCAARDPVTARRGILVSIGFWALFDLMTTSAGLYARLAMPEIGNPLLAFPLLADQLLPPLARGLFFAGMLSSMLAALQGTSLLSAVSLGKDVFGRGLGASQAQEERWSKTGLWVTFLLAFALARLVPSVVGLWYAVGSAVVPGLLFPLLGVYWTRWRVDGRWALASSAAATAAAASCLIYSRLAGHAPFGVEPMFPGLAAGLLLWTAGLLRRRHAA